MKLNFIQGEKSIYEIFFKKEIDKQCVFSSYVVHGKNKEEALGIAQKLGGDKSSIVHVNMQVEESLKTKGIKFLDLIDKELFTHTSAGMLSDFLRSEALNSNLSKTEVLKSSLGFKRVKFKVGKDFNKFRYDTERFLNKNPLLELILDFNGCGELLFFCNWDICSLLKKRIFLEDPIPFEFRSWEKLKYQGFNLIYDDKNLKDCVEHIRDVDPIIGIKPTKENPQEILKKFPESQFLVTNNMGSELDHIISAYWASEIFKIHKEQFWGCGLYTRHFFKKSHCFLGDVNWRQRSSQVIRSFEDSSLGSLGWGWDDWLSLRNWESL